MNNVQKIVHKSRDYVIEIVSSTGAETTTSWKQSESAVVYNVDKTNVSSIAINGNNLETPFPLQPNEIYTITIVKENNSVASTLKLFTRKDNVEVKTINTPSILQDNIQGTKSYYLHKNENKVTVIDSSLLDESNYISGFDWVTDPRTVLDLPVETAYEILWENFVWDSVNNRIIVVGRAYEAGNISRICMCQINCVTDLVTDLDGSPGAYSYFGLGLNYNIVNALYSPVNYVDDYFVVQSLYYAFKFPLSTLNSTSSYSFENNLNLFFRNGYVLRKQSFAFNKNKIYAGQALQSMSKDEGYERYGNFYQGYENVGGAIDNITENVFRGRDGVTQIEVYNNMSRIASVGIGYGYISKLFIPASSIRRMLITKQSTYSGDHHRAASLIDLDSLTNIKSELIYTDTDVTGCIDGDRLNSIGKFAVLSTGYENTQGRRIVYIIRDNPSENQNLLSSKLMLDYDSTIMISNTLRY